MTCPLTGNACDAAKNHCIYEVVFGKKKAVELCDKCLPEYLTLPQTQKEFLKESTDRKEASAQVQEAVVQTETTGPVTPGQLLRNLVGILQKKRDTPAVTEEPAKPEKHCPGCNSTMKEIAAAKKLGCMKCFDFFGKNVLAVLTKIHGHDRHVGKIPTQWVKNKAKAEAKVEANFKKKMSASKYIEYLEELLHNAVRKEDYDQAAAVRDQLKAIRPLKAEKDQLDKELKEACEQENLEQCAVLKDKIVEIKKKINEIK